MNGDGCSGKQKVLSRWSLSCLAAGALLAVLPAVRTPAKPLLWTPPIAISPPGTEDATGRFIQEDSLSGRTLLPFGKPVVGSGKKVFATWVQLTDPSDSSSMKVMFSWRDTTGTWSTPAPVTPPTFLRGPSIAVADGGQTLHILYNSKHTGRWEVYHVSSSNGGSTWGSPTPVTSEADTLAAKGSTARIDDMGRLWTCYSEQHPGRGVLRKIRFCDYYTPGSGWSRNPIRINASSYDALESPPRSTRVTRRSAST